jgi:group I intron endonuclease
MMGIYKFTNNINGKIYIGQSSNIQRRFNEHLRRTEQQIDQAIQKHGIDNFSFEILEECELDKLNERENYWIAFFDCLIPNGYNVKDGFALRGESHGSSKLTNEDVIFIRTCYKNKVYKTSAELWKHNYPELSESTIANVFFGKGWTHMMMEVYTKELSDYYYEQYVKSAVGGRNKKGEENPAAIVAEKDAIQMRIIYQNKERKEVFNEFKNYSERTITSIISGQNWKHLPIYKKREKIWVYPKDWTEEQIEDFKIILELQ